MKNEKEFLQELHSNHYVETGIYKVEELQPGIYHIDEEIKALPGGALKKDGTQNNPSSIYCVQTDEGLVIIDLGNPVKDTEEMDLILHALSNHKPVSILFTHGHFDHTGLAKTPSLFQDLNVEHAILPKDDLDITGNDLDYFKNCLTLCNDMSISLYGNDYEIIIVGGHTKGSCVIYNKTKNVVFSGDTFGSGYVWMLWDTMEDENPLKYLDTGLKKTIEIINENTILYGGHRWQQFSNSNPSAPGELTMKYLLSMLDVLSSIKSNTTLTSPYPVSPWAEDGIELSVAQGIAKIDTRPVFIENYKQ